MKEDGLIYIAILFFIFSVYLYINYIIIKRRIKRILSTIRNGDEYYLDLYNTATFNKERIIITILGTENDVIKYRYNDGSESSRDAYTLFYIDGFKKLVYDKN